MKELLKTCKGSMLLVIKKSKKLFIVYLACLHNVHEVV